MPDHKIARRPMAIDPDAFAEKKHLAHAAAELYLDDPARLTAEAVCERAGLSKEVFVAHFDEVDALLPAVYDLALDQYHLLRHATADYERFSFEERLATFYFILLDTLGEQRAFVAATFDTSIRRSSSFRKGVQSAIREIFTASDVPSTSQLITGFWPAQALYTEVTLQVVRHWVHDASEDAQETTALVDKLVAFTAELVTFRGVQRATDLAWYLVQIDIFGLGRLPLIGRLFRRS